MKHTHLRVECTKCKAVSFGSSPQGRVAQIDVEHEDDCPFLAAVNSDRVKEWVDANGYPIVAMVIGVNEAAGQA